MACRPSVFNHMRWMWKIVGHNIHRKWSVTADQVSAVIVKTTDYSAGMSESIM